jgi:CarD family transcriptional regulator
MDGSQTFRVGEKVVYPNHGVGIIETIANRVISSPAGGGEQQYYQLKIEASNLRVMVPFTNVESVGMRRVTDARAMVPILTYLRDSEPVACATDWKWRFKENSDKMRNGALAQVAEVLKSLVQLHQAKPLSYREKKMLDRAALLLVGEMASAENLSLERSLQLLQQTLAAAELILPPFDEEAS